MTVELHLGDCLDILPTLPSESVDAVITDPPYPHIKREYGHWTEAEWWDMMIPVVTETRRILKPTGSAMFILQPNSEKVGKMRGWLWEFMAWVCREWNMVQDAWWLNTAPMPGRRGQLMRQSLKACIWAGDPACYRNQRAALWDEAESSKLRYISARARRENKRHNSPGGQGVTKTTVGNAARRRGGVTPFNVFPCNTHNAAGTSGNSAGTPLPLADWWTRYICPPGGVVADWFMGSGTMGIAAVQNGCSFVGIERLDKPGYFPTAQERIAEVQPRLEGQNCIP